MAGWGWGRAGPKWHCHTVSPWVGRWCSELSESWQEVFGKPGKLPFQSYMQFSNSGEVGIGTHSAFVIKIRSQNDAYMGFVLVCYGY